MTAVCFIAPLTLTSPLQRTFPDSSQTVVAITMVLFTATSAGMWALTRDQLVAWSARLNVGVTISAALARTALVLLKQPGGRGIVWALGGLLWFALGVWISTRKARALSTTVEQSSAHCDQDVVS